MNPEGEPLAWDEWGFKLEVRSSKLEAFLICDFEICDLIS